MNVILLLLIIFLKMEMRRLLIDFNSLINYKKNSFIAVTIFTITELTTNSIIGIRKCICLNWLLSVDWLLNWINAEMFMLLDFWVYLMLIPLAKFFIHLAFLVVRQVQSLADGTNYKDIWWFITCISGDIFYI